MNGLEALAITGGGAVAGAVNAVVGSGSLVTFPTLVALGYPPVTANASNTVGLVPGGARGAVGYRRGRGGQLRRGRGPAGAPPARAGTRGAAPPPPPPRPGRPRR